MALTSGVVRGFSFEDYIMKNDEEHGRELRQVSYKGRYKLMWAQDDDEG